MNNQIKKISSFILITLLGYTFFSSFSNINNNSNVEELIIGIWINEIDGNDKWVFTNNGICKWYHDGDVVDEFNYSIAENSPQCGFEVKPSSELDGAEYFYLRMRDTDEDQATYCYEIFGITDAKLSINPLGKSNIFVFDRQ